MTVGLDEDRDLCVGGPCEVQETLEAQAQPMTWFTRDVEPRNPTAVLQPIEDSRSGAVLYGTEGSGDDDGQPSCQQKLSHGRHIHRPVTPE